MVVLCNSLMWRFIDTQNHYRKKKLIVTWSKRFKMKKGFKCFPHSAPLKILNFFAFSPTDWTPETCASCFKWNSVRHTLHLAKVLKYVLQKIYDNDKARAFRWDILHERGPLLINLSKRDGNDKTRYQNQLPVKTFNMPKNYNKKWNC